MATPTIVASQGSASIESDGTAIGTYGSYPALIVNGQAYVYDEIRVRRDRIIIYVEIIKHLRDSPLNLTELSLLTRLNFGMTKTCVDHLLSLGLVRAGLAKSIQYSITREGRLFLEASQKMLSYLDEQEMRQRTT